MNATKTEVVDDGRRPDRLGRMRTPRRRREELLAEYERSGLSQAAFARRAGVRYPTFAHWVQKRRRVLWSCGCRTRRRCRHLHRS